MSTSEHHGPEAFRAMVLNAVTGLCPCGRLRGKLGMFCCRMCSLGYSGHSQPCRERNTR